MKVRYTKNFLSFVKDAEQRVLETRECDFDGCKLCSSGEYYCTTNPATYLCAPEGYPCSRLAHVHVSNVEPCDPDPPQAQEPEAVKPCVAGFHLPDVETPSEPTKETT